MGELEERIKLLLDYNPQSGKIFWKTIPEKNLSDKIRNIRFSNKEAGGFDSKGYRAIQIDGKLYFSHRIAWFLHYGSWPEGQIDHINQLRADNRVDNIREVDYVTNSKNQLISSNNKSGTTGVHFHKSTGRWRAQINDYGVRKYLGSFSNIEDAIKARKQAEEILGFHENHGRKL